MSSVLVPLILFFLLLALNRVRAAAREFRSIDSLAAAPEADAAQPVLPALPETAPVQRTEPVAVLPPAVLPPATPLASRAPRSRYLLDGADPHPRRIDRVARLQRTMRGPGLCSPRRPS